MTPKIIWYNLVNIYFKTNKPKENCASVFVKRARKTKFETFITQQGNTMKKSYVTLIMSQFKNGKQFDYY